MILGEDGEGREYLVSGQWKCVGARFGQGHSGVYLDVVWANLMGLGLGWCVSIGGGDCMIVDKTQGGAM